MKALLHFSYGDSGQPAKLKWSYLQGYPESPLVGVTIGQLLEAGAERHPDREAVIFKQQGHRLTFQQLLQQACNLVQWKFVKHEKNYSPDCTAVEDEGKFGYFQCVVHLQVDK